VESKEEDSSEKERWIYGWMKRIGHDWFGLSWNDFI
jgi:hypothetical protein